MTPDAGRHLWHLRKNPVLAALPVARLESLAEAGELSERPRRTTLYLAGDIAEHVYFLHGGRVSLLYITNAGRTVNLGLHGGTDVFGESCLWTPAPREDTAVTATAVLLSRIPRVLLRQVLDDHPRVELRLSEQAVVRRDATILRLCVALTGSVRARLAGQLVELAERGHDTPDGRELAFPMTHQELAARIGTTRETVSIELARLERSRLLTRRGRKILLRDIPRLRTQARDDPPVRRPSRAGDPVTGNCGGGVHLPTMPAVG
jgi:CRP-like cAMP-binding protein